ncbi:DUF1874 domain-containing protein [Clostridium sp. D2Q-11]|uniref:DUF1874 domain-containing protein n=1 Tax=Anaeromonas frigoriresistens TaxID=2683708 RepID=A0A942Z784_9FIRM|nr:YddF family protein [Anaeromonas frigoriresistens]MBS4538402.1 DUF1874 domain-containing protein [Anaeromonas frigoriresistens]
MSNEKLPIALFNGTIATTNGTYKISDIGLAEARNMIKDHGFISAIGHEATAEILSEILEMKVPRNRIEFHQKIGQYAIVLKMKERAPEGKILTRYEMEKIGYNLKLMKRLN